MGGLTCPPPKLILCLRFAFEISKRVFGERGHQKIIPQRVLGGRGLQKPFPKGFLVGGVIKNCFPKVFWVGRVKSRLRFDFHMECVRNSSWVDFPVL